MQPYEEGKLMTSTDGNALVETANKLESKIKQLEARLIYAGGGDDKTILGRITGATGISYTDYAGAKLLATVTSYDEATGLYDTGDPRVARALRWEYTWDQVSGIGPEDPPEGTIGGDTIDQPTLGGLTDQTAKNTVEMPNFYPMMNYGLFDAPERIMGNGVKIKALIDNFPGFSLQPCPVNTIVRMFKVTNPATGGNDWWFEYVNGVDGICEGDS